MPAIRMGEVVGPAEAEQLLTGLLERYSPSQDEGPAVTYLVEQMEALGYHAYVDGAGNAVGELGAGEETLLLLGHIDTVRGSPALSSPPPTRDRSVPSGSSSRVRWRRRPPPPRARAT
jgi:acetylornithine deacetylase/succinyl-diaminopimelate desuccinylase-like protein